jgi:hypothetical protein
MTDRMLQTGAWVVFALTAAVILVNAGCMLVSPRAWFALPRWLRLQGPHARNLHEDRWSDLQMRLAGAAIVAVIVGTAFELMRSASSK